MELMIVDQLPADLQKPAEIEHASSDLQDEFDLARRIIQGHSAIYLLGQVARGARIDELEHSLQAIGTWIAELEHAVRMKAGYNSLATRLLSLIPDLFLTQSELGKFLRLSTAPGGDRYMPERALALIRKANYGLRATFACTPLGNAFFASSCACEVRHLTRARREYCG